MVEPSRHLVARLQLPNTLLPQNPPAGRPGIPRGLDTKSALAIRPRGVENMETSGVGNMGSSG